MPLMGSLFVGASGLQTSQNALNTTAHNLSNLDTTGYVRQQVLLSTSVYNTVAYSASSVSNQQVGSGVTYSKIRQVRDIFLDQTYRKESGRSAFYETSYKAVSSAESLLNELNDSSFSSSLDNLWTSVQELAKNPTSATIQTLLVQRASQFISKAQSVYNGLSDYQDNLNNELMEKIDRVNEIGAQIKTVNDKIREIESAGIETANDLRDTRNSLLDELSAYADITYTDDVFGNTCVKIEGVDFVTTATHYDIAVKVDATTGFYVPYWPQCATVNTDANGVRTVNTDGAEVFNTDVTISSVTNTDIGSLKSIMYARGDRRATYADLLDKETYDRDISQSTIMNIQAEFDQLVHGVVTAVNEVMAKASNPDTGYMCNEDGSPMQMFTKITTSAYNWNPVTSKWDYIEEDPTVTETLYSTSNITINSNLVKQPTLLSFKLEDGSEDYDTANALEDIFEEEKYILNPNLKTECNFSDYYSNLVSQISNTASVMYSVCSSQEITVNETDAARDQVMGVSSEEELSYMIKYQNAYNAASRYINVIDEMLEHILNTLGA